VQSAYDHARLYNSRINEVVETHQPGCPGIVKMLKLRAADKFPAALDPMKKENINPADEKLGAILRESRTFPGLPPRFQQNVWRRIEGAEAPVRAESWLDALSVLVLRPRLALAALAILVLVGSFAGALEGRQMARHEERMNYLASVAPRALR